MYRILLITMIAFLFGGCASSSKLLQRGNYDAAIQKSVRKLLKNPNDHEEILVLERAYNIANEQNNERIRFLKREGNIRNNPEILHLYNLMLVKEYAGDYKDRIVKKSIEEGFEYLLDDRGNVMKDSLGNDIKIPKYKDVFCTVIETHQRKSVNIDGTLDKETLLLVEIEPLPYPSDVDMIFRTAGVLRTAIAEAIKKNKNFIR